MGYCQNVLPTLSILGRTVTIGGKKYSFSDSSKLFSFSAHHLLYPPSLNLCSSPNIPGVFSPLGFCIGSSFYLVNTSRCIDDVLSFCFSRYPPGSLPNIFKTFTQIFIFYEVFPAMTPKIVDTPLQAGNSYSSPALYSQQHVSPLTHYVFSCLFTDCQYPLSLTFMRAHIFVLFTTKNLFFVPQCLQECLALS